MSRNPNLYYYVEVGLPKGHPAIEACVTRSERDHIPLRQLIKEAVLEVYSDTHDEDAPIARTKGQRAKRTRKAKTTVSNDVPDSSMALSSAAAFLDEAM